MPALGHTSDTTPTPVSSPRVSIEELPLDTSAHPAQVPIEAQTGDRFTLLINSIRQLFDDHDMNRRKSATYRFDKPEVSSFASLSTLASWPVNENIARLDIERHILEDVER